MIVLIDTREQTPYTFATYDVQTERGTLPTGDYSIPGFEDRLAIERKSLDDLIGCLSHGRERFEKELCRAKALDFFSVVIEGTLSDILAGRFRSRMTVNAVVETIAAFSTRYRTPFLFCGNRQGGERMTYSLLAKYGHNLLRAGGSSRREIAMRTFHLLDEQGTAVGRMILDDRVHGYAVLDCLPKPLAVVERQPGEPWSLKNLRLPPLGGGVRHPPASSIPVSPRSLEI